MLENDGKVLRFAAVMVRGVVFVLCSPTRTPILCLQDSPKAEDEHRKFIISYYLSDDTMTIFEPPQRSVQFPFHSPQNQYMEQECGDPGRQVPGENESDQTQQLS